MNPKETSTPLAASDVRFSRLCQSFVQHCNLATEPWSMDDNTKNTMKSTPANYAEESGTTPLSPQSFVQPRNLATEPWSKDDNTEQATESTPTNYAEDSGTTPLSPYLVKSLFEDSANSTK